MTKKGSEELGAPTPSKLNWAQRTDVGASQEDHIAPPETAQRPTTPEPEHQEASPVLSIQKEKHDVKKRRSARLNKRSVSPTEEAPATPPSPPKKTKIEGESSDPAPQSSVPEEDPVQTQREDADKASSRDDGRQSKHPDPTKEKTQPYDTDGTQYPDPADCPGYYLRGATWFSYDDDEIRKKLGVVQERLQEWSVEWTTVEEQLSDKDQRKLIAGLEGYCLQDDWASLVDRLPSNIVELLPLILTQALVAKDLFQNVVEDPFFYLNEDGGKVTGEHGQVSIPSRTEVHNLWQWCKQVEPSGVRDKWNSRKWLQITVRFLNAFTPETTFDPLLARHMKVLRDCRLYQLASNFLHESALLHPLLKTVSDSAKVRRFQELLHIYQIAGDLCIGMWTNEMDFEFGSFNSLGVFHEDIPHMEKHCYAEHEAKEKSDPADKGRTVLFMVQPTITRYCRLGREEDESLINRAIVIISNDDT
ncbi:hypothetical protein ABOM_000736 [Aspergillus bombycis]|uniref:Uncharacterized protein n=1 Tax=Aspergillus bombycis TaxID=109264 RepID=A0A1F8AHY5_9EURO|nr:hypothetical protein ABOM_000736 [Aspergillus bombycis]OGM50945.1 hypothetical protein ABOM_000736 [Aspergillus bombycis]